MEYNGAVYQLFMDCEKTYDSEERSIVQHSH
jgi:hypothetical protein